MGLVIWFWYVAETEKEAWSEGRKCLILTENEIVGNGGMEGSNTG